MKKRLLPIFLSILLLGGALLAPSAQAQTAEWTGVCVDTVGGNTDVATIQGIQCLVANILSIAVTGVGLAGFVMMIIGSFKYLLSGGNAKGTEAARGTITYAVVGLVVVLSAFIILNLIQAFTGISPDILLNFRIPESTEGL